MYSSSPAVIKLSEPHCTNCLAKSICVCEKMHNRPNCSFFKAIDLLSTLARRMVSKERSTALMDVGEGGGGSVSRTIGYTVLVASAN